LYAQGTCHPDVWQDSHKAIIFGGLVGSYGDSNHMEAENYVLNIIQ
jgi:hypothetical protein